MHLAILCEMVEADNQPPESSALNKLHKSFVKTERMAKREEPFSYLDDDLDSEVRNFQFHLAMKIEDASKKGLNADLRLAQGGYAQEGTILVNKIEPQTLKTLDFKWFPADKVTQHLKARDIINVRLSNGGIDARNQKYEQLFSIIYDPGFIKIEINHISMDKEPFLREPERAERYLAVAEVLMWLDQEVDKKLQSVVSTTP